MENFLNKDGGSILDVTKDGIVTMYINAFNVKDVQNDISLPGSFSKTFKDNFKNIFWYKNHDPEDILGIPLALYEDSVGAIAKAQFNLKKSIAMDMYEDYKLYAEHNRSIQHSVAVKAIKYDIKPNPENPNDDYDKIRTVSEWKMREFSSLTMQGANPYTPVLELKSEKDIMSELKFLKDALNSRYSEDRLKQFEMQLNKLESLITKAAICTLDDKPKDICENCGAEMDTEDETCKACGNPRKKAKSGYDYNYLIKNFKL